MNKIEINLLYYFHSGLEANIPTITLLNDFNGFSEEHQKTR